MTANGYVQLALYLIVLLALAKPLGGYMARVYRGQPIWMDRVLGWLERLVYRVGGVRPDSEQGWKRYTLAMLLFNFAGLLVVYALQRLQGVLPLNPQALGAVSPDSSFNTAVSFASNTTRGPVPAHRGVRHPPPLPLDLRGGRDHPALRRDQADRPDPGRPGPGVTEGDTPQWTSSDRPS